MFVSTCPQSAAIVIHPARSLSTTSVQKPSRCMICAARVFAQQQKNTPLRPKQRVTLSAYSFAAAAWSRNQTLLATRATG
jgi:hypothetical protein